MVVDEICDYAAALGTLPSPLRRNGVILLVGGLATCETKLTA